ncbi:uncharacterized protein UDID_18432 [Ustilago sp. UG-2017a]|nr:uncharacterized protein UDID_18432 [Ustilago sp. UG-2017a]
MSAKTAAAARARRTGARSSFLRPSLRQKVASPTAAAAHSEAQTFTVFVSIAVAFAFASAPSPVPLASLAKCFSWAKLGLSSLRLQLRCSPYFMIQTVVTRRRNPLLGVVRHIGLSRPSDLHHQPGFHFKVVEFGAAKSLKAYTLPLLCPGRCTSSAMRYGGCQDGQGNNKVCLCLLHMQVVNGDTDAAIHTLVPLKDRKTLCMVHSSSRPHDGSRRTLSRSCLPVSLPQFSLSSPRPPCLSLNKHPAGSSLRRRAIDR